MAYADYEICPGCDGKAVYMGEDEFPDGVAAWHEACLRKHVAQAADAERERLRKRFEQECEGDLYAAVADLFEPGSQRVSMEEAARLAGELPDPVHHHDVFSRIEASTEGGR